tara:strand:- start:172 stop:573 length:402 start_codon:yes stop_codon:yes gene_type:complete
MAAPNIVNVTTITGVTTFHAGIAVTTGGKGALGITTVVSNAASSGKVLKINSLVAASIGSTTGITLQYFNDVNHASAGSTVSIGMTMAVPTFSTLAIITKDNSVYLEENTALGIFAQPNTGTIDVVCSYEEIS